MLYVENSQKKFTSQKCHNYIKSFKKGTVSKMKDFKGFVIAILVILFIVCGLYGVIEIIKGLFSEMLYLIENIFS
jgi:hypothetical protein